MYNSAITRDHKSNKSKELIVRKIYLGYPTDVFKGREDIEFEIINEISGFFKVPYNSIQVAGSAKTGYSYHKERNFVEKESDLDIAIISQDLFLKYSEIVFGITKGFSNLSSFSKQKDFRDYKEYIAKGIFRPDLMPFGPEKKEWFKFFNGLSRKHFEIFKNINAGIYISQTFFEFKQLDNIERYIETQGGNF